jgi:Biogenesis of lysosome-related organelles complex-1 subunit 2
LAFSESRQVLEDQQQPHYIESVCSDNSLPKWPVFVQTPLHLFLWVLRARLSCILHFPLPVTTLDIRALAGMNESASFFYKALRERTESLKDSAVAATQHHKDAHIIAVEMENVQHSARRLEALVDRLDEYTRRMEQNLTH